MLSLTWIATYAAVAGGSAATYLGFRGEAGAAVVVGLLALLALGVRLMWLTDWRPGETTKRRLTALVMVMVVLAAVGGPVGTASAQGISTPVCSILGVIGQLFADSATCGASTENKQTRLDLYAGGASLGATGDSYVAQGSNLAETSRAAAWTEGKIALVNSLNNNSTEAEAQMAMESEIEDYYAGVEHNIIQQAEKQIEYAEYAASVEQNETGSNGSWVYMDLGNVQYGWDDFPVTPHNQTNATLVNGSIREISTWTVRNSDNLNIIHYVYHPNASGHQTSWTMRECPRETSPGEEGMAVPPCINTTSGNGSSAWILQGGDYANLLQTIRGQNSQLQANADSYVAGVYDEYVAGDVNVSDLLSPSELAARAATDYNSTGYHSFAGAELAAIGASGNLTTAVTVTRNNTTYQGTIFSTGDSNESWQTGETIQAGSDGNGVIYMADQSGNESQLRAWESGNISIESATDTQTGQNVTNISREQYVYESTNSSRLEETLNETAELRAELEALEQQQGIGIGLPDIGLGGLAVPAIALGAGYLLLRD